MSLFSQRKGIKSIKSIIQIDSMDKELRVGLWNSLQIYYWDRMDEDWISDNDEMDTLMKRFWLNYFKQPLDTLNDIWDRTYEIIRKYFFDCDWNEAYDFIEFVANNYPEEKGNEVFMKFCNLILEREVSGYRFVGGKITQITSEEEISAIEEALKISKPLKGVNTHLKSALKLSTNRKSPDYRNSIKESISAVEAICRLITEDNNATLGQALSVIENKVGLHPALKSALSSLYGYTSSAEGIRHALMDDPNLNFEDAKFMLVACSGFINYLISKSSRAGIKL